MRQWNLLFFVVCCVISMGARAADPDPQGGGNCAMSAAMGARSASVQSEESASPSPR